MTTAARPTFDPARGGTGRGEKDLSALSKQYSSRDLPGHTKLKYRYICELLTIFKVLFIIKFYHNLKIDREQGQGTSEELRQRDFRKELEEREVKATGKTIPAVVRRAIEANTAKKIKLDQIPPGNLDQDDPVDADTSSDDDSDEDDTAALLEELNKIKRERANDSIKKDQEKKQEDDRIRMENILSGNPLLTYSAGSKSDLKVCFINFNL